MVHAAALPVSGLAALEAVRDHGAVRAGQKVLVLGASGGVGGYAVQIATAGARRVIDYASTDVTALPDRYDVIIDINGRMPLGRLVRILTSEGTLVIVGGEDGGKLTGGIQRQFGARIRSAFTRRRLGFFISSESRAGLPELARLVASGHLRPTVDVVRPLSAVREAIDDLSAGRIRGKAVLTVAS